jgi:hypothetical protein
VRSYFKYSQTVALSQSNSNLQIPPLYLEGCFFIALPILLPIMIASYCKYRRVKQNCQVERLEKLWLMNIPETTF